LNRDGVSFAPLFRAVGAVLVLASALAASQGTAAPAPSTIRLVARDEPVRDVFLRLGAMAHLNITIGDDVHGNVNLSLSDATPDEALHAVCSQLRLRCTRNGRTVLVSMQNTAVLSLTLVPAARAGRVVRGLFPHLTVTEGGSGNTLIVSGSDADIAAARGVVQGLDVRDPRKPTTEALTLRAQPAAVVANRLRALFPAAKITPISRTTMLVTAAPSDLTQIKLAVAGIDASMPLPTTAPFSTEAVNVVQRRPQDIARSVESQVPHLRVAVSGPTVTISGAPEDVARAKALIAELDAPPFGTRYTQIYRLKNVDAQSVADLIKHAFPGADVNVDTSLNAISVTARAVDQQRIADGVAHLDGNPAASTNSGEEGQGPGSPLGTHATIQLRSIVPVTQGTSTSAQDIATAVQQALQTAHPELHATVPNGMQVIILTGSAVAIREAKQLVEELDVVPQSVVLDTEILELDENSSRNLGLQLGTTSIGTTFSEVVPSPGPNGLTAQFIGLQPFTRTGLSFQAQVNLLLQNGNARVLADPRITTLSGRTASIRAGDTISILTSIGGGTGTVATTQLESFQTGVTLDITPIITTAGELIVALHPIVNSLTGYLNGVPQISTRDTQTSVHLHDNETLVIGGLIQENTQRTESKIPLLGDLPLIGQAFRNENVTSTRNELIIVVTPHLLGGQTSTVPDAALPPGMVIPTALPLPTLAPGMTFPAARPLTPRPPAAPAKEAAGGRPTPGPSGTPSPQPLPSAFAQANTFVYGSPPPSTFAGPGDAPQIFYITLSPTVFMPNSTVHVNAITTTNVQRVTIGSGVGSITLATIAPGMWQGVFTANVLGLPPGATSLRLTLTATRGDGQNASVPINVSIMRSSPVNDVQL
jgi:type II secretory pathway component GspD/PulD (secretin)